MVNASLIEFLKTGQLGPFQMLSQRTTLLDTLGPPPYWDGFGGIAYDESTIWVYDSIQFNFDDEFRLEDTHIGFYCTFKNGIVKYSDWSNPYVNLDDLTIEAICTPDKFDGSMNANGIPTTQFEISGRRQMIDTESGVQARFIALMDFAASMESEIPVRTDSQYLHRITTLKLT